MSVGNKKVGIFNPETEEDVKIDEGQLAVTDKGLYPSIIDFTRNAEGKLETLTTQVDGVTKETTFIRTDGKLSRIETIIS